MSMPALPLAALLLLAVAFVSVLLAALIALALWSMRPRREPPPPPDDDEPPEPWEPDPGGLAVPLKRGQLALAA